MLQSSTPAKSAREKYVPWSGIVMLILILRNDQSLSHFMQYWALILTPKCPSLLVITTRPTIEAPPDQEIQVTHTKSRRIMRQVGISYFASLQARLTCTSTKKYSVTKKEMWEAGIWELHAVDLWFHENWKLKRGLNGDMGVSVQVDEVRVTISIHCIFSARLKYTLAHPFGFTTSHLEKVDTLFMLIV